MLKSVIPECTFSSNISTRLIVVFIVGPLVDMSRFIFLPPPPNISIMYTMVWGKRGGGRRKKARLLILRNEHSSWLHDFTIIFKFD